MDEQTQKILTDFTETCKKRESSQKVFWRMVAIFSTLIIISVFYAGVSFNRMSATIDRLEIGLEESEKAIDMQNCVHNRVVMDAFDDIHPTYEIRSKELQRLSLYHQLQIRGGI